jgi:NAD(P) transhydrogenase subunit alpha
MKMGVPAETRPGETRVAATPETVKKLAAQHEVLVESGAGLHAAATDEAYAAAGARIVGRDEAFGADLVLKVRSPDAAERALLRPGAALVGMLNPFDTDNLAALAQARVTAFALEAAPRITRAQSMDVLSSQANIAGYKAVLMAANAYGRFMPMLMTAAGTVKAARVLVKGVGVAGLQAIATAKRLGAVIEASDVRPPVKEQVESLGAKFIDVPYLTEEEREIAQGAGGYARPMPADWMRRQAELVHERAKLADIIVTTALIPGRKAPILIGEDTVRHETGFGDRRHGHRAGRQLPADGTRQDRRQAWRDPHRRAEPGRAGAGRRFQPVCAQRAGFPQAGGRQGWPPGRRPRGRDRARGAGGHRRGRGTQVRGTTGAPIHIDECGRRASWKSAIPSST